MHDAKRLRSVADSACYSKSTGNSPDRCWKYQREFFVLSRHPSISGSFVCVAIVVTVLWCSIDRTAAQDQSSRHREGLRVQTPDRFALINAKIIVSPSKTIDRGMVVINGRQIVQVSEVMTPPPDAQVVDLEGRVIYSGIIDAYSEFRVKDEALRTGSKYWNPLIRAEVDLTQQPIVDAALNKSIREEGIACRLVAPTGGIVKGQSCLLLSLDDDINESLLKGQVAQHAVLTVRFGLANSSVEYPRSPMGAVALARQAFSDARWYADAWRIARGNSAIAPPEQNVSLAALQPVLQAQQPLIIDCQNEIFTLRADRFAREFGVPLILHGSGREYQRLNDVAALGRPILLPVDFPKPPAVGSREGALNAPLESLMHWDLAPENPARLAAAGVTFAFCSHPSSEKNQFLPNVRRAVHRGLDPQRALAALTTVPAEIFGVQSMVGTVEPGKLANLIVADIDLFDRKCKIVETWVAGQRFIHGPPDVAKVADLWSLNVTGISTVKELRLLIERSDKGFEARIETDTESDKSDAQKKDPEAGAPDDAKPAAEAKNEGEDKVKDKDKPDTRVKDFSVQGNRISGSIDGRLLQTEGWVQLTLVILGDQAAGQAILANGTARSATAKRIEEKAKESSNEQDPDASDEADESKTSKSSKGKSGVDPEKDLPATYPTNFPLGPFGVADLPAPPKLTVFRGATIWTCGSQGVMENASLVIANGAIVDVLAADKQLPAEAQIIEAKGLHITPGIIDCHSHMATDSGVNEGGQAITAEVRIGDLIDCHDITIYRQLAGGVTAANILHGSANPIGGQNQVIKLRWGANDQQMKFAEAPQGIKFALGENVKQSNRSDANRTRYPQTRMGVEQLIDDSFRAARQYRRRQSEWRTLGQGLPPRVDLELEAMAEILEGQRWVHCHSYRQDEILALIRVLDQHGVTIGSFQHILEGYKVAEKMAEHGAMASAFADWWAYKFEVYDAIPHAGALMHQAGLVVSFNSDDAELGRHLNHEAAKAVRYGGVDPIEALKFVTLNPAKQLRIDAYVGSLEPNKHADFVVWNGPPLSNFSRTEQTWVDGRKYFDRTDDLHRQREAATMHQTLVQKVLASGQEPANDEEKSDDSGLWPRYDEYCHGHDHDENE